MYPEFFIPLFTMLTPVALAAILLYYRYLRARLRHDTLLQLAEKGISPPPELLREPQPAYCERRRALVLIGAGLGCMAMFVVLPFQLPDGTHARDLWGVGLLPLMTGLGYLVSWWLNHQEETGK
jgi:hypothetical protein